MTTRTVLGTCHHDCPDSCGWVVTVTDGQAVKLRGNPDHPYSRGELCPKVNRLLDRVHTPDRLLHPLIRTGPKGAGEFRQASWDEALALVAERVGAVIAEHGGEAVLPFWDAGTQGVIQMTCLDRRFFAHLGASRPVGSICGATAGAGTASTYGTGRAADPMDVVHAEVVVLWGTNTRLTNRHLWPFVEEARRAGARIVVIDPLRTLTAEAADWFLQPLPGTDVALMLGVMHVLIRDDLIDHDYVSAHAEGFDDLAARVREWTPDRVAEACGLAPTDVEELAQLIGSTKRTFIRTLIGAEHHESGAMFFRTLACIPVLTGAWTVQGGGFSRSTGIWATQHVDGSVFDPVDSPSTRPVNVNHLGRELTTPATGIHALFVWCVNPVVSFPQANLIKQGLAREDLFTVVSEQFMTDTARFADVVFPAATQIEQLDLVESWGSMHIGYNDQAIEPRGEAVPNTELWRRLARAFAITDPLFELDDSALIALALRGHDIDELRSRGWAAHDLPRPHLPYATGGFATASGKASLRNDGLAALGHDPLPAYTPPPAATEHHPLRLQTPKTHTRFLNSTYSHHHGAMEDGPYVELDPADAAARGIAEGDLVRVHNDAGSLDLPARFTGRVRSGVVAVPWAWWGDAANVNALTSDAPTDWGGGVAYSDTLVEVTSVR